VCNCSSHSEWCDFTDGDTELIEDGKAMLAEIADAYIAKRSTSLDTDNELPEIRFYYEGVEVRCCVTLPLQRVANMS